MARKSDKRDLGEGLIAIGAGIIASGLLRRQPKLSRIGLGIGVTVSGLRLWNRYGSPFY